MNYQQYVKDKRQEDRNNFMKTVVRQNIKRVLGQDASINKFASILEETEFVFEPGDKPLLRIIEEITNE